MLDLVIGEFDDGLESEIEKGDETQIKRNLKNKQNAAINDKIDHIFNELTQEIYVEQRRERRQKSPTRNVFDPLPAPPLAKGVGRGREHLEGVRGKAGKVDAGNEGVKGRGKSWQEQERRGRGQQHDRRKRSDSCEDDRPPPGVVQAAKQSYLHKTKETRAEVVLYNEEGQAAGGSEKVKVDVHNHAAAAGSESSSSGGGNRTKSPGVARPSPPSQVPAVATKEKAVIKELREKVEGKQGKISKFSQRAGNSSSAIGKEEPRKDPSGSDSSSAGQQGRPGKPKRATSEAVRLESVAEEGRGQNREDRHQGQERHHHQEPVQDQQE